MRQLILLMTLAIGSVTAEDLKNADSRVGENALAAGLGTLVFGLITRDDDAVRNAAGVAAAAVVVTGVHERAGTKRTSESWERTIGEDNSAGLVALIKRDYRSARQHFAVGGQAAEPAFKRAAVWGKTLVAYDVGDDEQVDQLLEAALNIDPKLADKAAARNELARLSDKLTELRKQYK